MVIEFSANGLVYVLFRHRRTVLALFIASIVLAVAYCLLATARYEADASVVINFNRQLTGSLSEQGTSNEPSAAAEADEIVNSYALVLQSNTLARDVINDIGLAKVYPNIAKQTTPSRFADVVTKILGIYRTPMERAIKRFTTRDLDVEVAKNSTVLRISVYNRDPDVATRTLDVLTDKFLHQQAQIGRDPQLSFAKQQVAIYKKRVGDAQAAMEAFQLRNKIYSMDEGNSYLLKQRSDLESQLSTNNIRVEEDTEKDKATSRQLQTLPETVILPQEDRDAAIDAARTQLVELQVRQQNLLANFGDDSPIVKANNEQITKVESYLDGYPKRKPLVQTSANNAYQVVQASLLQARSDLLAAKKSQHVIQREINNISERLASRSRQEGRYQDLVREYQLDDENYRTYLQAVQQARIADDLNKEKGTTAAVYDPAHLLSASPVKPQKALILSLGMFIGALLSLSVAFLRESWDERFNTRRQIESILDLPMLGSLQEFGNRGSREAIKS